MLSLRSHALFVLALLSAAACATPDQRSSSDVAQRGAPEAPGSDAQAELPDSAGSSADASAAADGSGVGPDVTDAPDTMGTETQGTPDQDALPSDVAAPDTVAVSPACPQGVPAACAVTFTTPATSPLAQSYVWLSGDLLTPAWPKSAQDGAVPLTLAEGSWSATVDLPHGRVVAYKFLAGWPDNPGPVWFNQAGAFGDSPNSVRVVDCSALVCGVPSTRAQLVAATLKAHGDEVRLSQGLVGLGVGVVVDGAVAALGGFGLADQAKAVPVEPLQTRFRWASVSKTLAGALAARLASAGKLKLDDDAAAVLDSQGVYKAPTHRVIPCKGGTLTHKGETIACAKGWFTVPLSPAESKLSYRHLLGHLAGVPHYSNGIKNPSPPASKADDPAVNTGPAWALSYLSGLPLIGVPGAAYSYSSFGFNLVGVALGASQKTTFEAAVKAELLTPLQLTGVVPDREWTSIPHRATGYWKGDDGTVLPQGSTDVSWKLPGGGYVSTVADLAAWCRALSQGAPLDDQAKALAWTKQTTSGGKTVGYGLGFSVNKRKGKTWVGHSGSQQKVRSNLRLYPAEQLCVVLMTNSTWADVGKLTNRLEDLVRASLAAATP